MSIALRIIDIATAALPPGRSDARVESVSLEIGKLTAVVPGSLRFCFRIAARGTPLEGAELEIEEIPVVVACSECGSESEQRGFPFTCANCQSQSVELICGRELLVTSLEIADEAG